MLAKYVILTAALSAFGHPCLAQTGAEDIVTWNEDVKGWYLGVDPSIGNGCFMYALYDGGTFLRFQFNPQQDLVNFIVGNDNWQSLEEGKLYEIEVAFGRESPWSGDAEVRFLGSTPSLSLDVPYSEDRAATFIEELRRTSLVDISYAGRSVDTLNLSGSYAAVTELVNCQSEMMSSSGGSDPFSSSADPFQ